MRRSTARLGFNHLQTHLGASTAACVPQSARISLEGQPEWAYASSARCLFSCWPRQYR
jgi:hypothetical protein